MGLKTVHLSDVADTVDLRFDPLYVSLLDPIRPLTLRIGQGVPIAKPYFKQVANGLNLPRTAYNQEAEDPRLLYASVRALSQFSIQAAQCQPLKDPSVFNYGFDIYQDVATSAEILVTRSGTTGVAWPAAVRDNTDVSIVPSGFVIRATCDNSFLNPVYVAAILNHPVWRRWSTALATGKAQRNISQDNLAQIMIPLLPRDGQDRIAEGYSEALVRVDTVLAEEDDITGICDNVLRQQAGLQFDPLRLNNFTFDTVNLANYAESPMLRLDPRFYRNDVQAVIDQLECMSCVTVGALLRKDRGLIKGKQPRIILDEEESVARVIATISIQAGQVVYEQTKVALESDVEQAGEWTLRDRDLLLTMDGEGSIGKSAVFDGTYPAITDSQIGILRHGSRDARSSLTV